MFYKNNCKVTFAGKINYLGGSSTVVRAKKELKKMCGILGLWSNSSDFEENSLQIKKWLIKPGIVAQITLVFWSDKDSSFFLSHQRLSIIDLTNDGNQPMLSKTGRYVISFNGEIYNYRELKVELEKNNKNIKWKSSSDTEVLLELIETYGLKQTLQKCRGMFAFSIWDRKEKKIAVS